MRLFTVLLLLCLSQWSVGQEIVPSNRILGQILDNKTKKPIEGVIVQIMDVQPLQSTLSDAAGYFELPQVPLGRRRLYLQHERYGSMVVPALEVTAGQALQLDLEMEELLQQLEDVQITIQQRKTTKDLPINNMALSSIRSFTIDEVRRYSGARSDPARLAANFAGVNNSDDSQNDIIVRGNTPLAIQWRLEGLPIPSPNYFSITGTSGGPLPLLNVNTLRNSDFLSGAFPAEYGNVIGGIFDIGLREGNRSQFEGVAQVGITGLEANLEGPLSKKGNSSFIAGYRYSVLGLFQRLGADFGTTAVPDFQDLTFKLDFEEGKWGKFSAYGMGGLANITFFAAQRDSTDLYWRANLDNYLKVGMGATGLSHRLRLGSRSYWQNNLGLSANFDDSHRDSVSADFSTKIPYYEYRHLTMLMSWSSSLTTRFSNRYTQRSGFLVTNYYLDYLDHDLVRGVKHREFKGHTQLFQIYTQHLIKLSDRLSLNAGLHGQWLTLNNRYALGPRLALAWQPKPSHRFSLAAGLHHQMQPFNLYLNQERRANGSLNLENRNLDFTQALHIVGGYDWAIADNWRLKIELYGQFLDKVPVSLRDSLFSMLNSGDEILLPVAVDLVNRGKGRQMGLELTLEKFFSKDFYGLFTTTLFDAKAMPLDGQWRNSRFNDNYIVRLLLGKEFKFGKYRNQALTVDTRFTATGGGYYTPIDLPRSQALGYEVLRRDQAFGQRFRPYWRWDVKLGFHVNSRKNAISHRFYLDLLNVLGNKNVFDINYDPQRAQAVEVLQLGFFPDFQYKVNFGFRPKNVPPRD